MVLRGSELDSRDMKCSSNPKRERNLLKESWPVVSLCRSAKARITLWSGMIITPTLKYSSAPSESMDRPIERLSCDAIIHPHPVVTVCHACSECRRVGILTIVKPESSQYISQLQFLEDLQYV